MTMSNVKVFKGLHDYIKKSGIKIFDIFSIFDKDKSGFISKNEYFQLLNEILHSIDSDPTKDKQMKEEFMRFVDVNNDGRISLFEFNRVFHQFGNYTLDELMPNENARKDLFSIIEKAYDCDIDIEQSMIELDVFEDGGIETHVFRHFLKTLPFGLTNNEVDDYLQNQIDYTNVGKVNYMKLIHTERFKRIKFLWHINHGRYEYKNI